MKAIAEEKGAEPGQVALAWVLTRGGHVVPIPGTTKRRHLEQNVAALDVTLTDDDLARIDRVAPQGAAAGDRYPDMSFREPVRGGRSGEDGAGCRSFIGDRSLAGGRRCSPRHPPG